jgi:hypothetical protein
MHTTALAVFTAINTTHAPVFLRDHGLAIKTGIVLDSAVIKLLRPHWTTSPPDVIRNHNGVFFSVWLDETKLSSPMLRTNIHAKKFRDAGFPKIAARDFAGRFRNEAKGLLSTWPNVSYPRGPGSLFEAYHPFVLDTLERDTLALMKAFVPLAPIIDHLLSEPNTR